MAGKEYTGKDVHPWKVATHDGKPVLDEKGKPLTGLSGYADAQKAVKKYGGVAMRA